jgi:hypothetical protein
MRIAIITWCTYNNFGTYLQAYALQQYLKSMGFEVGLLDDSKFIEIRKSYLHRFVSRIKSELKKIIKPSLKKTEQLDNISIRLFSEFRNKYLIIDKNVIPLSGVSNRYDLFICGSDQIWNPGGFADHNNKDFFFANFTHKKKISYAPSLGVMTIPKEYKRHFAELISDFSSLSVREKTSIKPLEELTNKKIICVVDPTFLLTSREWNQLIEGINIERRENYVLLYLLSYNIDYLEYAKAFASKFHLNIKIIQSIGVDFKEDKTEPAGPLEFLHLIKNADYVFTDSFHAIIFSIIFEKQFLAFKRFSDNDILSQNTRVNDLLEICGLKNRFIGSKQLSDINNLKIIDFKSLKKDIETMILASKEYLIKAITK